MSIASEITRISGNIADAYTALDGKGATLPAAGSQNSANLADTIDTITTGGGGGNVEQAALRAVMDKVTVNYTYKQAYEDGWSFNDYYKNSASTSTDTLFGNSFPLCGIYFDYSLTPNILYVYKNGFDTNPGKAIKVPNGAIVTDAVVENGGSAEMQSTFKIDFTNATEKWIVFCNGGLSSDGVIIASFYNSSSMSSFDYLFGLHECVTWFEWDLVSSTYTSENKYEKNMSSTTVFGSGRIFDLIVNRGTMLKGFNVSNNFYVKKGTDPESITGTNFNISDIFFPVSTAVYDSFVKFINNNTMWTYGVTTYSIDLGQNPSGWNKVARAAFFPFILDASNVTNAIYINNHGSYIINNDAKGHFSPIKELFIKIPAQNVEWVQYHETSSADGYAINYITPAAMTYLANNAPSVTNKTLTIGKFNKQNNPTAVATLESKGWTVS